MQRDDLLCNCISHVPLDMGWIIAKYVGNVNLAYRDNPDCPLCCSRSRHTTMSVIVIITVSKNKNTTSVNQILEG